MAKIFNLNNGKWVEVQFYNPTKKDIIVYENINGFIVPIGIGQY